MKQENPNLNSPEVEQSYRNGYKCIAKFMCPLDHATVCTNLKKEICATPACINKYHSTDDKGDLHLYEVCSLQFFFFPVDDLLGFDELSSVLQAFTFFLGFLRKISCYEEN